VNEPPAGNAQQSFDERGGIDAASHVAYRVFSFDSHQPFGHGLLTSLLSSGGEKSLAVTRQRLLNRARSGSQKVLAREPHRAKIRISGIVRILRVPLAFVSRSFAKSHCSILLSSGFVVRALAGSS
jgi:hypothetical protein